MRVSIFDVQTAGITISSALVSATEGASNATYTVQLDSRPTSTVTVTLDTSLATLDDLYVSPRTLVFDPTVDVGTDASIAWNSVRTIQVQAITDGVVEGQETYAISHSSESADPGYNSTAYAVFAPQSTVTVRVFEVEAASIFLGAQTVAVAEGGVAK